MKQNWYKRYKTLGKWHYKHNLTCSHYSFKFLLLWVGHIQNYMIWTKDTFHSFKKTFTDWKKEPSVVRSCGNYTPPMADKQRLQSKSNKVLSLLISSACLRFNSRPPLIDSDYLQTLQAIKASLKKWFVISAERLFESGIKIILQIIWKFIVLSSVLCC